ncbi:MAG: CheR family methyltransferase [Sporichthyaceae bacterium]
MNVLEAVAALLRAEAGLTADLPLRQRLGSYLERIRRDGESDADLVDRLRGDPSARTALVEAMTIHETSFFRDEGQFLGLVTEILPTLPDPVQVWSAGCSTGQEPYSLAMVLAEQGRAGTVIGTDVSGGALETASRGVYSERELRGLSPERRERWLRPGAGGWTVADELRRRVQFRRHNLLAESPPVTPRPLVFCRNVLIYFDDADTVRALRSLGRGLAPDGWLFLGFSEVLWRIDPGWSAVGVGNAFAYRRRAPEPPRVAPPTRRPGPSARPRPAAARAQSPGASAGVAQTWREHLDAGHAATAAGEHAAAVVAYRAAAYLAPEEASAHLHLALALARSGEQAAARRALRTARSAAAGLGDAAAMGLHGWDDATVARWLDTEIDRGSTP